MAESILKAIVQLADAAETAGGQLLHIGLNPRAYEQFLGEVQAAGGDAGGWTTIVSTQGGRVAVHNHVPVGDLTFKLPGREEWFDPNG